LPGAGSNAESSATPASGQAGTSKDASGTKDANAPSSKTTIAGPNVGLGALSELISPLLSGAKK
jgi:hypothetical protein